MRLPVFLGRRPIEPIDHDLAAFYEGLLQEINRDVFRNGDWRLCERSGWPDNQSCQNILAWWCAREDERYLIVVNFSEENVQGRIHGPWHELSGKTWRLVDGLSGESYDRSGDEMREDGLYVELGPWQCYFFQMLAL